MSLVGPWLSTTSTKKRSSKITKAKQEELERGWKERNQRLKEMKLPKETFEQYLEWVYGNGKKTKTKTANLSKNSSTAETQSKIRHSSTNYQPDNYITAGNEQSRDVAHIPSLKSWVTGPCSSKPSPTYTGSKMIGISQMAKSNAVPVFNKDEIMDIARMRR